MRKILLVFVFAIGVSIPIVMADISTPTVTNVYFEKDGEPCEEDIEYTVNCYGYTSWPGDEWFGEELEEGSYTPEVVYSYSASCPEYGCEIYEDYYMNYRHIDYCDLDGTADGESFYLSNFGNLPYTGSCDYSMEGFENESRQCDTYFEISSGLFSDVPSDYVYYDAISYLKENGIAEGYEDGTYKPDNTINRAEFLKVVMSVNDLDMPACSVTGSLFSDVVGDVWYFDYVCDAVTLNVISGYSDGSFKPGQEINFAEAAKIIVNVFGYELSNLYTNDYVEWYGAYVAILQDKDAVPASIDSVSHLITRGEVAEMIYRLANDL